MFAMLPPPPPLRSPAIPVSALAKQIYSLDTPYLLASYTTVYPHITPARAYNITLAAERLKGTVIPAGGEFSYNVTVGLRRAGAGFKEGRIFVGNRIVNGIGGGVCQVATTVYDVVLLAHLQVLERHPHTLTVPYVPPGQDATVDLGLIDFRFKNPTPGPVLLWSWVQGDRVTVALYGTKPRAKVSIHHKILAWHPISEEKVSDPTLPKGSEQVEAPGQKGCDVASWLLVRKPGVAPIREELGEDHYVASPRIIHVGIGRASGCR